MNRNTELTEVHSQRLFSGGNKISLRSDEHLTNGQTANGSLLVLNPNGAAVMPWAIEKMATPNEDGLTLD